MSTTAMSTSAMSRTRMPAVPDETLTDQEIQILAYQTCLPREAVSRELGMSRQVLQGHLLAITSKLATDQWALAGGDNGVIRLNDTDWPFA